MEQATWWALFVGLALVAGLIVGLVWRILIANRAVGVARALTFALIMLVGAMAVGLVGATIVAELFDSNDAAVVPFLLPPAFAIAWLIGFRLVVRHRSVARIRQRRLVAAAGSHEVTGYLRQTVGGSGAPAPAASRAAVASPPPPPPTGRALPTPMLVGNRDAAQPPVRLQAGIEDLSLPPPPPPGS